MAVGTISAAKELTPVAYQSLMLVEITFNDKVTNPTVLRLSSHTLNTADGGFQYNGHDYLPRLINDQMSAAQALSETGVDEPPTMSIEIADPDNYINLNYGDNIGFKGAQMLVRFIFWNADNNDFSSDSVIKFVGLCETPGVGEKTLTLTAISKMNMSQTSLPATHVQPTCPWNFPVTAAQRQNSADTDDDPSWECGYSPDATGGSQVGNFQATTTQSGSIISTDLTITVGSITGALPPVPFPFNIGSEACFVMLVAGSTWTIIRGAQGTVAASHSSAAITVPFSECAKTRGDCMARLGNSALVNIAVDGDITHDTSGRPTGRFGGVLWAPPTSSWDRGYITGKWEEIINSSNEAKYGDLIPFCYGTTWVDPLIVNVVGDANYTKMECLCCYGQVGYIYDVVVNGIRVPHVNNDTQITAPPGELKGGNIGGGFWQAVSSGSRNGGLNADTLYDKQGDPYGSLCVIEVVVPRKVADSSSIPRVSVRLDGPKVRVYTDPSTYTRVFTSNPVWIILDALIWAGWKASELDIASFITAAGKADTQIFFRNINGVSVNTMPVERNGGGTTPYTKYSVSFALRQRRSAADVIRGLRNACQAILIPNFDTGLLQILIKETLAAQQPAHIQLNGVDASNYNTAVASLLGDASVANGYVAYAFDESNITRKKGSNESSFRILPRSISQTPNLVSVTFQDLENRQAFDSLSLTDTEDTSRVTKEVTGNFQVDGLNTFDRVRRIVWTYMSEQYRGNKRLSYDGQIIGDTGGTMVAEWETTFKAIHLKIGDLVWVSYQQRNLVNQLFRITKIEPGSNGQRIKLTASFHNDVWYLNTYGQEDAPKYRSAYRSRQGRPAQAWSPGAIAPDAGDSMFLPTDKTFNLTQLYETAADDTSIAKLSVDGFLPVNSFPSSPNPPFVDTAMTTTNSGGTIVGGRTIWICICAKDVTGSVYKISAPSYPAKTFVPAGATNTVTISIPNWDIATAGYVLFAGDNPNKLTYQQDADTTPSTVTLTSYRESDWGLPDTEFDHLIMYIKRINHSGVIGVPVVSVTSSTIKISILAGTAMTTNAFLGYDLSLLALNTTAANQTALQSPIPVFNAKILSNTADTFTLDVGLDGNVPDPTVVPRGDGTFGLIVGDVITVRSKPTYGTDATGNYMEDANWVNNFNFLDNPVAINAITNANPGAVTTATSHGYTTGDKVYLQSMGGMTGFPLLITATVVDGTHFTIGIDTTSSGTYTGGGICSRMPPGLTTNSEKGTIARAISGTGRGMTVKISSNTSTRIYIDGAWPITPDSTTRWVYEEVSWQLNQPGDSVTNTDRTATAAMITNVDNYKNKTLLVQALAVDAGDEESLEFHSPVRDLFLFGGAGILGFEGAISLNVPGTLGIGSDQAPASFLNKTATAKAVRVVLDTAPTGADLVINLNAAGSLWMTLTVTAGTTSVSATAPQLAAAAPITASQNVTLDITAVGTTFPGSDIAVIVFF